MDHNMLIWLTCLDHHILIWLYDQEVFAHWLWLNLLDLSKLYFLPVLTYHITLLISTSSSWTCLIISAATLLGMFSITFCNIDSLLTGMPLSLMLLLYMCCLILSGKFIPSTIFLRSLLYFWLTSSLQIYQLCVVNCSKHLHPCLICISIPEVEVKTSNLLSYQIWATPTLISLMNASWLISHKWRTSTLRGSPWGFL